jgi:gliding motility-associated-like protein
VDFENLSSGDNKPLTYQWRLGRQERTGAITTSAEAPDYRYSDTGNYTIKLAVTNSKGCTDSLVREDYVRIKPTVINYAPSAFSPNDDGTNDVYRVEARYFTDFSIQIFNRWGEQVYSADDYETHGWDGTYEGEKAPGGVYTYVVKATGMDGEDYTFSGTITLIR